MTDPTAKPGNEPEPCPRWDGDRIVFAHNGNSRWTVSPNGAGGATISEQFQYPKDAPWESYGDAGAYLTRSEALGLLAALQTVLDSYKEQKHD